MILLAKILFNTDANKFHPILYMESPLPGNPDNIFRFKSIGHHTDGFDSLEEAVTELKSYPNTEGKNEYEYIFKIDDIIEWDGKDIPADIQLLSKEDVLLEQVAPKK